MATSKMTNEEKFGAIVIIIAYLLMIAYLFY